MTIIHISTAITWRGGEQQIAYLIDGLAKKNIAQLVVCPTGSPLHKFCVSKSITVVPFKKQTAFGFKLALKIKQRCNDHDCPIVHAHDSHAHTAAFLSALVWRNNSPVIVHRRVSFPIKKGFLSGFKYNLPSVKKIICVSDFVRSVVDEGLSKPGKTITVYDGIDLLKFRDKEKGSLLRQKFQIAANQTLIGNISAITTEKDIHSFVDTAALLLKNNNQLRFIVIGDGSEKETITEYIRQKGLTECIIMAGFMDNIPEIIHELDLLLFTSVQEGLGTSLLDAFAAGIPVVATRAGGVPEIVRDRVTGLTAAVKNPVALANAVEELLNNPTLKVKLVENARRFVESFSTEVMIAKILEVYAKVKA